MTNNELDRIIKLEGTDYDRRRKLTNQQIAKIRRAKSNGASIADLASAYRVSYNTIKYHVDPEFKKEFNCKRLSYRFAPYDYVAQKESRVAYKRAIFEGTI